MNYIDLDTLNLVYKKDFSTNDITLEYFLSPTNLLPNKLFNLKPIANTNSFIALNNLNDLVYVSYDPIRNEIKLAKATSNHQIDDRFESFYLSDRYILANTKTKVLGFNLSDLIKESSFGKYEFKVDLNRNNNLDYYGCSSDLNYVYTIENKKQLRFYRYSDGKKLADIPLYSETSFVTCTNDYICLYMQDKRVISYLICDPNDSEGNTMKRIKRLKSR